MEHEVTLSIEESIQRLKAEIIAQDWRLSQNRASQLEAAFACLRQRFKTRKATHAMLIMAGSVLDYIKKKGGNPPETIDFLKEAMAHVVSLYEEIAYDPEKEEQVFQTLFKRFNHLKDIIKHKKSAPPAPYPVEDIQGQPITNNGPADCPEPPSSPTKTIGNEDVELLISELKNTLEKADEVGSAIGRVLDELLEKHHFENESKTIGSVQQGPSVSEPFFKPDESPKTKPTHRPRIESCPLTALKELVVNGKTIAVRANAVSLSRPVKASKLSLYLKHSNVPLKDFSGLFQGLSRQFNGSLSQIQTSKLKQLKLPIMTPEGNDWPVTPDEKASKLVVISYGNWHGIIPCSSIEDLKGNMIKFEKQKNGDIAGLGHLDNGKQVELLDLQRILHREGFLVMV